MIGVLVAATVVAIGVLWSLDRAAVRRSQAEEKRIEALWTAHSGGPQAVFDDVWQGRLEELERIVETMPKRWEDVRVEIKRREGRAYHHVKRVRDQLSEHGLEDEAIEGLAGELQLVDGGAGEEEELPPVQESLGEVHQDPDDWQAALKRLKYGGR